MTRLIRTAAVLLATVAGLSVNNAQAAVTSVFFSNNASCTGPNTQTFTPGGAAVQMSLCMNATTATCGHTVVLQAAAAGESGRFVVTGLTLGGSFPDPNSTTSPLPLAVNNPPIVADLGGTSNGTVAAGNNRLLATFTLTPQANATNNSYTIGLNGVSIVAEDLDGTCGATTVPAEITMNTVPTGAPTMVLNRQPAPAFTSPAAVTFTTTASNTFTVTATGSPAPTIALTTGTLPAGVTFTPATGVLAGTPSVTGTFNLTFTASNGVTPNAVQSFVLTVGGQASQTISFTNPGVQTFSSTPIPLTATASSGLAVSFGTQSPSICTVTGSNVTMVSLGTCTISASQAGNATYLAATPVQQSFAITGTVPGAPTISAATAGDSQAVVSFSAPASTGGSAITGYTATCGGISATGTTSPITVTGLTNGVQYGCSVTATNSLGTSAASATLNVTPSGAAALSLTGVKSRKVHPTMPTPTTFDLSVDTSVALGGNVTTEPRLIGAGHVIVFQFNNTITSGGTVTVLDSGMAAVGTPSIAISGNEVLVTITGVPDRSRVNITLSNVNGAGGTFSAPIGFLAADVNNNRAVNVGDVLGASARSGNAIDLTNFRFDFNVNGAINVGDVLGISARSGNNLNP